MTPEQYKNYKRSSAIRTILYQFHKTIQAYNCKRKNVPVYPYREIERAQFEIENLYKGDK
jgi:ribosomal protein S20